MTANRYDPPTYNPRTPPLAATGYPEPDGVTPDPVYWPDGRLRGVNYLVGEAMATPEQADAGRYDMTLRRYYDAWRRLGRLVFLAVGAIGDQGLNGDSGQVLVDQHFAGIFALPATVDGDGVLVTWDVESADLWALGLDYGCAVSDAPWPGGLPDPTASIGQIAGLEYIGPGEARIVPNKGLNIARENQVYVVIEARPPQFPAIPLHGETDGPWRPDPAEITRFFLGRGAYQRDTGDIVEDNPVYVIGRDDYESVGQLIGLPGTRRLQIGASMDYRLKTYYGFGVLKARTGEFQDGIEQFRSFIEFDAGSDNVGVLAAIGAQMVSEPRGVPAKRSPAGGALSVADTGYHFERAVTRRIGSQGVAEISAISGDGEAAVQRARAREYLSIAFDAGTPAEHLAGESHIVVAAGGAVEWRLPAFCDSRSADPPRERDKAVSGTVAAVEDLGGAQYALEFDLAERLVAVAVPGDPDPPPIAYESGGNVVCPPMALEVDNPGSGALLGDRQRLIYPGDVIAIDGALALVLEAEAFGGAAVAGAMELPEYAPGVPSALYAVYHNRDRIVVQVTGPSGAGFGTWGGTPAIDRVSQSAVSPVGETLTVEYWDSTAGAWIALDVVDDYTYDPLAGNVSLLAGALPAETVRLRASGQFFDRRRLYPCEVANVLHGAVDGACEGYVALAYDAAPRALAVPVSTWGSPEAVGSTTNLAAADSPDDVGWITTAEDLPWTFGEALGGGSIGVQLNAEGGFLTNVYTLTADIVGVTVPVPGRWLAAEIAAAVCDVVIEDPRRYVGENLNPTGEPADNDFSDMRLIGYIVQTDEHGAVTSLTATDASLPLAGLVYDSEADVSRGTVDITAIMQSLAGRTYADDDQLFMALVGPWGDPSALVAADPVALFRSFFRAYTYDPALPDANDNPAATVEWITYGAIAINNFRLRPDAASLAATRYAGDGAAL